MQFFEECLTKQFLPHLISACGLSVKSIFSQPFNRRLEAYAQKLTWANYSCSDPIAYIGPYEVKIIFLELLLYYLK